jgi:hypothetical protein
MRQVLLKLPTGGMEPAVCNQAKAPERDAHPLWVDAVEKCRGVVGFAIGGRFRIDELRLAIVTL